MPAQSGGTIRSQGQLDGKFKAEWADICLKILALSMTGVVSPPTFTASFQPKPQYERHGRNTSDAGEPEANEPEQALGEWGGRLL
jgi:hypothetical protein